MMKRVYKVLICPLLAVLLINLFYILNVKADFNGQYFEVPTVSQNAYIFFMNYGLNFNLNQQNLTTITTTTYNYDYVKMTPYGQNNYGPYYTFDYITGGVVNRNPGESSQVNNTTRQYLSFNEMRGTLNTYSEYNGSNRLRIEPGQRWILAFYGNRATDVLSWYTLYNRGVLNYNIQRTTLLGSGTYQYWHKQIMVLENTGNEWDYFTINFNFNNPNNYICVPLYLGLESQLPDYFAQELGLETSIEKAINNLTNVMYHGDSNTTNIINNNTNTTNNFNNASSDLHDAEIEALTDFNSALQNVDHENPLINNNGFLNASNFVAMTFNKIINDDDSNAIRSIIVLSLLLGIALTIIGKLRNN